MRNLIMAGVFAVMPVYGGWAIYLSAFSHDASYASLVFDSATATLLSTGTWTAIIQFALAYLMFRRIK